MSRISGLIIFVANCILLVQSALKKDASLGFASPFNGPKAKSSKLNTNSIHIPTVFKTSLMMAEDAGNVPPKSPEDTVSPSVSEVSSTAEGVTDIAGGVAAVEVEEEEELTEAQKAKIERQKEIERLKAAEKFITKMTGEFQCSQCNYIYKPDEGTRNVMPGTSFADLPSGWNCPECGAPKNFFDALTITIAGFEENQGYGFGTNSLTGDQKNGLIFGGLGLFFILFLSGYLLD